MYIYDKYDTYILRIKYIYTYFVSLFLRLDFVLNLIASNGLEIAPFRNILPPQSEKACGGPDLRVESSKTIKITLISIFLKKFLTKG